MSLKRFFVEDVHDKAGKLELDQRLWVHDQNLINQWLKVLRLKEGDEIVLFNLLKERIYKIAEIEFPHSVLLEMVTELKPQVSSKHIYLLWSLLKKDKNEWIMQKATEIGVKNFVPIIADRSEKTDLNIERGRKIIIEAVEQCGRSDIPELREPISLKAALEEYETIPLLVCDQTAGENMISDDSSLGLLIGPEGGWSEVEKEMFKQYNNIKYINICPFILRAETAAIIAAAKAIS